VILAPHLHEPVRPDPVFAVAARARAAREAGLDVIDASLGVMMDDDSRLWVMPTPERVLHELPGDEASGYSPFLGTQGFREVVGNRLPSPPGLHQTVIATPGASGAVFLAVYACLQTGDVLLAHRPCWSNYRTIAREHGLGLRWYPYLDDSGRFHLDALATGARELLAAQGRAVVVLNAPAHNPTGYSLAPDEWRAVAAALASLCRRGDPVVLLVDAAYIEFAAQPERERRLAEHFAGLPDNFLLAVAWSGSKSYTKYGLRIGALAAYSKAGEEIEALEHAVNGLTRGTWSNTPRHGMMLVERICRDPVLLDALRAERAEMCDVLARREALFSAAAELDRDPYHAGFFTIVRHPEPEAAAAALEADGVFAVPTWGGLRVALAGVPTQQVERLARALATVRT